jgi:hypothetical protein
MLNLFQNLLDYQGLFEFIAALGLQDEKGRIRI